MSKRRDRWPINARHGTVELIGRRPQHLPYLRIEGDGSGAVIVTNAATLRRLARLIRVALGDSDE